MIRDFATLRGDLYGGITAAVVALPLALAFGVASGLGAVAGLYGAIAAGFFAAVFGGTPAQVSGPTGPMTVVTAAIVAQHADRLDTAFAIVILGGVFQLLFGVVRVGRFVSYTPYSVISGFMSGIGLIIILIQTLPFAGLDTLPGGPVAAIRAWPEVVTRFNPHAVAVAAVALAVMILWPKPLRTFLPRPLAALIVGTVLSLTVFTDAPAIGEVPTGLPQIQIPLFDPADLARIIQPAFVLALLGTIDSLLTSLVADSITRTRHNSDRELIGQGIGNIAAGLLGAVPGAGATMRTVVNVRAGGRTPVSGAFHAVILLALALGLGPLAAKIPHAALAGILIKVGWDIIDWGYLRRVRWAPRDELIVMFVTLALTVFVDLITAVAVGLIVAAFATARWMEREELKGLTAVALPEDGRPDETEFAEYPGLHEHILMVTLRGRFSYASARELTKRISARTKGYRTIVLDLTGAAHIDTSVAMAIDELIVSAQSQDINCILAGLTGEAKATLEALGILEELEPTEIVDTRADAIHRAASLNSD